MESVNWNANPRRKCSGGGVRFWRDSMLLHWRKKEEEEEEGKEENEKRKKQNVTEKTNKRPPVLF